MSVSKKEMQAIIAGVIASMQQPTVKVAPAVARRAKLDASHPVVQIAIAKATVGKVVCDSAELLEIAALTIPSIPQGTTRFTLSSANKGWAFVGKECREVAVTAAQAKHLRGMIEAQRTA